MSDAVAGTYDGERIPDVYPPPPGKLKVTDNRWEFNAAVDTMVRGGIPRTAAEELANRAVDRQESSLQQWAEHLVRVKRDGAKVWSS